MSPQYQDDDRYAVQRARYLSRATELRTVEAKAVAYSERGYSHSGIAAQMGTSDSTVKDYLERAMARYGLEICETNVLPGEEPPDYTPVEPGYHDTRPPKGAKQWLVMVERQQKKLPQEWFNDVVMAARSDL